MNLLIVGDVHLGKGQNLGRQSIGSALNSRIIDQINLLDWVYDIAVNKNIKHIILTGDVFEDPKPHYNLVVLFLDWLQKCSDYNIHVHIVAGNHDILRSGQFITSPLDIISSADIQNVFVYKKLNTLHLENVSITFLPFRDRRSFNTDSNSEAISLLRQQILYESSIIDNLNLKILIGHLALEGAIPVGYELDELTNELHCPIDMFKRYDYVLMGHVHKFQFLSDDLNIGHIGSLDISDFGEADQQKYIAIISPDQNDNKIDYIQIPTRPLKHIVIKLEDNINVTQFIEENLSKYADELNNAIVKVSIILPANYSLSIDRNLIEKYIYSMGAFHISKISEEKTFVSLKKQINESIDNSVNELSAIKTYSSLVDEKIRIDFINLASTIVQEYKENLK